MRGNFTAHFQQLTIMWNAITTPFTLAARAIGLTRPEDPESSGSESDSEVQMSQTVTRSQATSLPRLFLTGKWRKSEHEDRVRMIKDYFYENVTLVTAQDEAHGQANFAHKQLVDFGYIDALWNEFYRKKPDLVDTEYEPLFVYFGAGRGSAQASVLTADGKILNSYYGDGFPRLKEGESHTYDNIAKIWGEIISDYDEGGCIVSVMMFDAMYYQAKEKHCATLKDNDYIYKEWDTDYDSWYNNEETYTAIGFGRNDNQVSQPTFLCVRNFKTDNDVSKKVHFLPTDQGDYAWDIGSGKMALVHTETGAQMKNIEFPDEVFTDHTEFLKMAETISRRSKVYAPIVIDGAWQEKSDAFVEEAKELDQKVITLTAEEKCRNLAVFVHKQLYRDGFIPRMEDDFTNTPCTKRQPDPVYVYMMTFGDKAYGVTLLAEDDKYTRFYEAEHNNVTSVWEQVLLDHDFRNAIQHVVLLGQLYDMANQSTPSLVHLNGAPLVDSWDNDTDCNWIRSEEDFKSIGFDVEGLKGYKGGDRSSMPSFLALQRFKTGTHTGDFVNHYPHFLPTERNMVWHLETDMLTFVDTVTGEVLWASQLDSSTLDISDIIDIIRDRPL